VAVGYPVTKALVWLTDGGLVGDGTVRRKDVLPEATSAPSPLNFLQRPPYCGPAIEWMSQFT